jgi:arginase family enzyme
MTGAFGLLGVPSSAAAHGPGQEKAPAALRRGGLPERLAAAGVRVADYGDLPVVRWRPDPHQRRPHNLQAVLGVLRETSRRVGEILAAELAGLGPARPLLRDDRLLLFGYTDYPGAEHDVLVRRDLAGLPADRIRGRPEQAAEEALALVRASTDRFLLHLDVDVVDFLDLPVADIPLHNAGLTFDEAMRCLTVFAGHQSLAGLIVTEFNPDHGAEDGSTTDALVRGLVGALAG